MCDHYCWLTTLTRLSPARYYPVIITHPNLRHSPFWMRCRVSLTVFLFVSTFCDKFWWTLRSEYAKIQSRERERGMFLMIKHSVDNPQWWSLDTPNSFCAISSQPEVLRSSPLHCTDNYLGRSPFVNEIFYKILLHIRYQISIHSI